MNRLLLSCTLGALATACALPPLPPPVAAPAPPPGWLSPTDHPEPLSAGWWHRFGDPVLDDWVARALAHNTDLLTAAARVQEARAQERVARAARWPTLALGVGVTRSRSVDAFGRGSSSTAEEPVFQASYEVDAFGQIADQIEAARFGALSADRARDAAALSVAAATATGYITLRALDARLDVLRDTLRSRAESLALAQDRARVGYTSDLEWRQAQAEYESTAQQVPQAEAAIARQEHALALLAGEPPAAIPRGLPLDRLAIPPVPDTLPSELLRRRPDIAQAESALAASDASLKAARAQFLPSVNLNASVGKVFSPELPSAVRIWSVGASVLAPIFEGGRLQGQFEAAGARRDESAWAYRRTVLNAFREVEDNLAGLTRLRDQEVHVNAQRVAVAEALRHATNRYDAGYASYTDQLDAQRGLLSAELLQTQARADELTTIVALCQAMGGGWRISAPASSPARP